MKINFEAIPTHTVSATPTADGTITIKDGGEAVASGSEVCEGTTLTITAAPGAGKKFGNWTVTGATPASTTDATTTLNVGTSDITIEATFEDAVTHPVHWSVNGAIVKTDNVIENEAITFAALPSGIPAGYEFQGWVTEANKIDTQTNDTPEANYVTSATCTAETTYYAVMAVSTTTTTSDVLTVSTTGVTGTSYTAWSDKTVTSSAVYAGQSAKPSNYDAIQMRATSPSGIISTVSGGKAKKVYVIWDSTTDSGRTLNIYGKNTAYSEASDLYSSSASTKGTLLGSIICGTSTELTIDGNYTYIGMCSSKSAMYIDQITIDWENSNTSNYCTTVPTATIAINETCTDGANFYATYSNSQAFVVPGDLAVSTIKVEDGKLQLTGYAEGDIVKANTGVLVSSTTNGSHSVTLAAGGTEPDGNMLKASSVEMTGSNTKFYRLTMHDGEPGFWWGAADGAAFTLDANKAYLAVPDDAHVRGFSLTDEADGINAIGNEALTTKNAIFDLSGRRVVKPTKGLYIVNGKKIIYE